MERIFYINKYHRGHHTIIKGTLKELTKYFSYTLDCGYSWNGKINPNPKTYKSLISNLNKSYHEIQGGCFEQDYVTEAIETDFHTLHNMKNIVTKMKESDTKKTLLSYIDDMEMDLGD